jgi:hypothetical protein
VVNCLDLGYFRNAFGTAAGDPGYLDFNGDGAINGLDLGQFRLRFGTSLPSAPATDRRLSSPPSRRVTWVVRPSLPRWAGAIEPTRARPFLAPCGFVPRRLPLIRISGLPHHDFRRDKHSYLMSVS